MRIRARACLAFTHPLALEFGLGLSDLGLLFPDDLLFLRDEPGVKFFEIPAIQAA